MKNAVLKLTVATTLLTIACQSSFAYNLGVMIRNFLKLSGETLEHTIMQSTVISLVAVIVAIVLAMVGLFQIRKENRHLTRCFYCAVAGVIVFPVGFVLGQILPGTLFFSVLVMGMMMALPVAILFLLYYGLDQLAEDYKISLEADMKPCIYFFITYFILPTVPPFSHYAMWIKLLCTVAIFHRMYFYVRAFSKGQV